MEEYVAQGELATVPCLFLFECETYRGFFFFGYDCLQYVNSDPNYQGDGTTTNKATRNRTVGSGLDRIELSGLTYTASSLLLYELLAMIVYE